MYEAFYRLREKPFHVTADPAFLYFSRHHQEAMEHLLYGIEQRLGFLLITGEVGTGKTILVKALVDRVGHPVKTALLLQSTLSSQQMLKSILQDFGCTAIGSSRGKLMLNLEQFLLRLAAAGECAVLIIDEAQVLSRHALEQIRLLSNIETPKAKLLQIVLVGQPELVERLNDHRLRALRQRIAVSYEIQPLEEQEVAAYIHHRLRIAGAGATPSFTTEALQLIAKLSEGIPRRINLLCDRALLAGFVRESQVIDAALLEQIGQEQDLLKKGGNHEFDRRCLTQSR